MVVMIILGYRDGKHSISGGERLFDFIPLVWNGIHMQLYVQQLSFERRERFLYDRCRGHTKM